MVFNNPYDLGFGNRFLKMTPKSQFTTGKKTHKLDFIKNLSLYIKKYQKSKKTVYRTRENTCKSYI